MHCQMCDSVSETPSGQVNNISRVSGARMATATVTYIGCTKLNNAESVLDSIYMDATDRIKKNSQAPEHFCQSDLPIALQAVLPTF